jgi:DHA1 family tetracycline resistance protein-like MFS transporter
MTTPEATGASLERPSRRRAAVVFVFVTVALDMIALGVIAPVFVPLVVGFLHGDMQRAAAIVGAFGTVFALMQFVWAPILGVLSDRFGRKPVIVLSNIGMGLDYFVMALAPALWWLLAGRIISGVTSATATVSGAYIADVTPPEQRARAFGMIGAAFGVGFVLGPAIGGVFGQIDPRAPFWVAGVLCVLNGVYGAFVLPESLRRENRSRRFVWSKANPLGALRLLRSHPELFALATVTFLNTLAGIVVQTIWVLYATYRYGWQPATTGVSLAVIGVCSSATQMLAIGPFVKRFGERRALFTGTAFGVAALVICGAAPSTGLFFAGIVPMCLWGLAPAACQALMTRRVTPQEQGELQGAIGSIRGFSSLIGPVMYTTVFAIGIAHGVPGAPWFLSAVIIAAAGLPVVREHRDDEPAGATVPVDPVEGETANVTL